MAEQKLDHLAIIMDGNARWAKKNSLTISQGHQQGIKNIEPIIKYCLAQGVSSLTLYSFSVENFTRPEEEVNNLMAAVENYIENGAEEMIKKYQPKNKTSRRGRGIKKIFIKEDSIY